MRRILLLIALYFLCCPVFAQYVYTIKADSVKITNCDSAELILENHTQGVPGFLFNTGRGRTIFKRGAQQLTSSSYLIGADTLKLPNAWVQGGNSFGAAGILGTNDNNPLNLYTAGLLRASLTSAGRLLIGTTTDNGNILQANGTIYSGGYTNSATPLRGPASNVGGAVRLRWGGGDGWYMGFYFQDTALARAYIASGSDNRTLRIVDGIGVTFLTTPVVCVGIENSINGKLSVVNPVTAGSPYDDFSAFHQNATLDTTYYDFIVKKTGNVVIDGPTFSTDNGNQLQVYGNSSLSGNVGVGTATPSAQLHTTGSVRFAGLTQDSSQTRILVSDANGNLYYRSASSLAANDLIRSSLAVNGPIKAKSLILSQSDWPDYVFDSSYTLPPLQNLETYIRQHHHLPDVSPAATVARDGIDVGSNQAVLLKKIEELTLYTITQDKKLNEQGQQIDALRQEIDALKQMIKAKINL